VKLNQTTEQQGNKSARGVQNSRSLKDSEQQTWPTSLSKQHRGLLHTDEQQVRQRQSGGTPEQSYFGPQVQLATACEQQQERGSEEVRSYQKQEARLPQISDQQVKVPFTGEQHVRLAHSVTKQANPSSSSSAGTINLPSTDEQQIILSSHSEQQIRLGAVSSEEKKDIIGQAEQPNEFRRNQSEQVAYYLAQTSYQAREELSPGNSTPVVKRSDTNGQDPSKHVAKKDSALDSRGVFSPSKDDISAVGGPHGFLQPTAEATSSPLLDVNGGGHSAAELSATARKSASPPAYRKEIPRANVKSLHIQYI
jgi:hypothetical protein